MANGQCVCEDGFNDVNGVCQQCSDGFLYLNGNCVKVCGQNEEVCMNDMTQCCCSAGFGRKENKCELCDQDQFLVGQFCASCPINAIYGISTKKCVCSDGSELREGFCTNVCGSFEVFVNGVCQCFQGLGRVNGVCQQCPAGT